MIEYFRLQIEYLWNAACREPQGRTIDLKKTEHHAAQAPALRE